MGLALALETGSVITQPQAMAASHVQDFPLRTSLATKDRVQAVRNKLTRLFVFEQPFLKNPSFILIPKSVTYCRRMHKIFLKRGKQEVKSWFAAVKLCEKRIPFGPEGNSQLLDIESSPCSKEFFPFYNPWDEEKLRCLLIAIRNYSDDGQCDKYEIIDH